MARSFCTPVKNVSLANFLLTTKILGMNGMLASFEANTTSFDIFSLNLKITCFCQILRNDRRFYHFPL